MGILPNAIYVFSTIPLEFQCNSLETLIGQFSASYGKTKSPGNQNPSFTVGTNNIKYIEETLTKHVKNQYEVLKEEI
jgi:hypothetical protein